MLSSTGSAAVIETIPDETRDSALMLMLLSKGSVAVLEITYCGRECFEVLGARVGDFGGQAETRVYRFWQMTVAKQARHQRRGGQMGKRNGARAFSV